MMQTPAKFHGLEIVDVGTSRYQGYDINYEWKSRLGIAGFGVCQHYRYGKLQTLYVSTDQQENKKKVYRFQHGNAKEIMATGYSVPDPHIWRTGWCKEANGPFFDLHVPENSHRLTVRGYGESVSLEFR